MPDGFIQLPADGAGKKLRTFDSGTDHIQYVRDDNPLVSFIGRASTYRIPGRAGTANQNLLAMWNGSASKVVKVTAVGVDLVQQAVKAATVLPPMIRFYRLLASYTNGTTVTKNAVDTALSSDAGITIGQDASADGTNSASGLAATVSGGALTQEFAPRLVAIGTTPATNLYEPFDKEIFFDADPLILRPSTGFLLRLDYTLATQNPTTDMWLANLIWTEE